MFHNEGILFVIYKVQKLTMTYHNHPYLVTMTYHNHPCLVTMTYYNHPYLVTMFVVLVSCIVMLYIDNTTCLKWLVSKPLKLVQVHLIQYLRRFGFFTIVIS